MKQLWIKVLFPFLGILILILDAKTAIAGATEGLQLCLQVLIPTLFPFFIFSILLTGALGATKLPAKNGCFFIGLLGGYPTGAKSISDSLRSGQINREEAKWLLSFCNNAGPSLIFGIGMVLFDDLLACFSLWIIHIMSALMVGCLTPKISKTKSNSSSKEFPSVSVAMKQAIVTMTTVCGWVILFRTLQTVLGRWIFWFLPKTLQIILIGFLELSNGCCMLIEIGPKGLQFILFSAFLGFGGFCVTMQTVSVLSANRISIRHYLPSKMAHSALSCLLASAVQRFLFPTQFYALQPSIIAILFFIIGIYALLSQKHKISVAFQRRMMYNSSVKTVTSKR